MQIKQPLLKGFVRSRYKRFMADIDLDDETVVAHCPNTGAMTGCYTLNAPVWVTEHNDPARKLKYTWQISYVKGDLVVVNTHLANKVVAEKLSELWPDVDEWRGEYRIPGLEGRLDFSGFRDGELCRVVEVKSVTWLQPSAIGVFPDATSERARKHVATLQSARARGIEAALVFCAMHTGIKSVRPAWEIDPEYAQAVKDANEEGVDVVALGVDIDIEGRTISASQRLDVLFDRMDALEALA